jgi:hypothetical protein
MKPARCLPLLIALHIPARLEAPAPVIPDLLLGRFVDDYGISHLITDTSWTLGGRDRYRIVFSNDSAQYLIAKNDSANTADPGKWSRIDWTRLANMPNYEWAFCLIEYQADSRTEAESNTSADREHPRIGCNGFPFSRMRRDADSSGSNY